MATNSEVIRAKLTRLGIEIQDAEMDAFSVDTDLVLTDEYATTTALKAKRVLALILRDLLVTPDVSEGQYSAKYDRAAVKSYYGALCGELGIDNEFVEVVSQPTITNASHLW